MQQIARWLRCKISLCIKIMDNSNRTKALTLLTIKKDKLTEILKLTEQKNLTATEDSLEDYVNLISERQKIFDYINKIDSTLESPELEYNQLIEDDSFSKEAKPILSEISNIAKKIVELDKKNQYLAEGILNDIKKELKTVNKTKNLNLYYQYDSSSDASWYFDKKK